MPGIGSFYARLAQQPAISVRTPTLLRRYRLCPPAIRDFKGDTWLRGAAGPWSITQPDSELGIDEIDKFIDKKRKSLSDVIEAFLRNPEPPTWIPPSYATPSNQEFLRNLRVPTYANGSPSLLFHDLDVCDSQQIEEIFGQRRHMFICNTSGSGKTRRMLEGLTKYWGFYFVAAPDINRVGIPDLEQSLERMAEDPQWVSDLSGLSPARRAGQNDLNTRIARKELRKILAARIVVFKLFLQLAIKVDGELLEKHKRIWLLVQSAWLTPEETLHPFHQVMEGCLRNASPEALDILIFRLQDIREQYLPGARFIFGLDEVQHAARLYPYCFISSSNRRGYRSIIREIARVFSYLGIDLVVSGTGLPLEELREVLVSGVSKADIFVFHNLGMFDTWEKLKPFLERYLPTSFLQSPGGYRLEKRIREYLLGRYRFSASFLEYLLMTGLESPHKLLNEFIFRHSTRFPVDRGEPFTTNEPDLRMEINVRGFDWERFGDDLNARRATAEIVQSHLKLGGTPTFGPVTDKVVEYGVARLRDRHQGHIVEPLAFLSVMSWLEAQGLNLKSNIRLRLGHSKDSRPDAFEELVVLYLLRILSRPIPLSTVFDFHSTPPEWAHEPAQVVGRLGGINVPVDALGKTTQNPGLAVAHYAERIQDVLDWLENSNTAPAVLIPGNHFGPDVMMRCKVLGIIIVILGHMKSSVTGNTTSLKPETTADALTSLHENHWFKRKSLEERQKLIDAIGRHPVLRFVGGYPLPPNLNSHARSVTQALAALGSNVALATLKLDTFRLNFISEQEVECLLAPLDHALAQKQEQYQVQKLGRKEKSPPKQKISRDK